MVFSLNATDSFADDIGVVSSVRYHLYGWLLTQY